MNTKLISQSKSKIKQPLVVLTGGPCSGKTTLINALSSLGYITYPEQALALINKLINTWGHEEFCSWKESNNKNFQLMILKEQAKIEAYIPLSKLCFLDRGRLDTLAYFKHANIEIPKYIEDLALGFSKPHRNYDLIIQCETLNNFQERENSGRSETREQSFSISKLLTQTYQEYGYPVTALKEAPLADRISDLLSKVDEFKNNDKLHRPKKINEAKNYIRNATYEQFTPY
jgi:predicted ATPase